MADAHAKLADQTDEGADDRDEVPLSRRLAGFLSKLHTDVDDRVRRRKPIEDRWIEDLRQYQGKYTRAQIEEIQRVEGSTLFVNLTRPKTNTMIARLNDLLFPTDDRNWGIKPTPVPETNGRERAVASQEETAEKAKAQAMAAGEDAAARDDTAGKQQAEQAAQAADAQLSQAQAAREELQGLLEEARGRADLMQEEMDDVLKQARYGAQARDMIEDACKLGTGVMKGPVVGDKVQSSWQRTETEQPDGTKSQEFGLAHASDDKPGIYRVDPWAFFPETDARRIEDSASTFERHLMTRQQLRRLARRDDIDDEGVRRLLKAGIESADVPAYLTDLHEIGEQNTKTEIERYVVWEFTGPLEPEDIRLLAEARGDQDLVDEIDSDDFDPLEEFNVRLWFCQNELLGFAQHPLDSGETLYSVFNLERDEATMFGYGLPYLMRSDQKAFNAGWRMMLDNAGLSAGPQILINKKAVTPQDGSWTLKPHKAWLLDDTKLTPNTNVNPFQSIEISTRQDQLANIITMSRQQMDEVTSLPQIAQGEAGATPTQTAQGMSILMNSANIVFRRIVRNFDDDMTVPNMRRMYHFLMQFSDKETIKGDYEVDARGSSVLLVREMQAQNLILLRGQFGDDPSIKTYHMMREIFRAHMLSPDEFMHTETEARKRAQEQTDPSVQIEQQKLKLSEQEIQVRREESQAKIEIANLDADTKRFVAEMDFEADMNELAEKLNIERDKLDSAYAETRMKERSRERTLAAEVAMQDRTGVSSGGAV